MYIIFINSFIKASQTVMEHTNILYIIYYYFICEYILKKHNNLIRESQNEYKKIKNPSG